MIKGSIFAGINSRHSIAAGSSCLIVTCPQLPFRPLRLWVDPRICDEFIILGVHIGCALSGFVNTEPVSASMFSTVRDHLPVLDAALDRDGVVKINISKPALDVLGLDIAFPLMKPGMDIVVDVQNIGGNARIFRGAIIGTEY